MSTSMPISSRLCNSLAGPRSRLPCSTTSIPHFLLGRRPINLKRSTARLRIGYHAIPIGLYYFNDHGALRVDDIYSTDLAPRGTLRAGCVKLRSRTDFRRVGSAFFRWNTGFET
jgi:hypothetical protein